MSNLTSPFFHRVLFLMLVVPIVLAGATSLVQAQQDQTPARGFSPNGSYALTDLETINTANGDMMLRIPLASLPPARGGLAARLFLIYNSKLWDSHAYFQYAQRRNRNVLKSPKHHLQSNTPITEKGR